MDGLILKPNQVGTITEALDTHAYAQSYGMITIPSGRSGGAVGDIVADLALALEAPQTVQLLYALDPAGDKLSLEALSVEECAGEIIKYLGESAQ